MKVFHQLGHKHNWNLEVFYRNNIGDGFIFGAFNLDSSKFHDETLSGYPMDNILERSFIDLQYYGKTKSHGIGKFSTYNFHPANQNAKAQTEIYADSSISKGIQFEENIGLRNIIVPNFCLDVNSDFNKLIKLPNRIIQKKKGNAKYFLTIALTKETLRNETDLDFLLNLLTDQDIAFDGYYIVAEPTIEYKQKLTTDYRFLENLIKFLFVLKKQKFEVFYAYANLESILLSSLDLLDYVSIGTYENLRNFNVNRYIHEESGGPSKGWYFSEKLLNFIKAQELPKIRIQNGLELIRNDNNIFSDVILNENYAWNTHKPDVHKNYLVSIYKILKQIDSYESIEKRLSYTLQLLKNAMDGYKLLNDKKIYLINESSDYHLEPWYTFLEGKL